ncbi:hypothetical protein PRIC2_007795 [Phytophthora ramorum]
MQWDDIRPLWLGLWIKDVKDLRGIVERFAKVSYARTKDAMDVCLLYVALGKKKVLSALAKLAQSDSNKTLASFLENDFSDKRWSNAAIRNAYSLLSKKKYEAAAAFFLVCEPPRIQDAIRVLAVRLGDPSLALVIARIVEYNADDKLQHDFTTSQAGITPVGDITKQLLEQDVIPLFRRKCEVWLESCALWWLEEFEHAWAVLLPQFQDVDVWGDNEFQVDRNYVYEAALAVMHPHAYLHIVEVCFLLSELGRVSALRKWVEYVSLSMMHSCSTFASCCIAEDVYRDWEGLTIQLCYILNLDAHCQISIPAQVIAHISVAVRTGIIFLGWARQRTDIVRQAVSLPFYTYGTINVPSTAEPGPPLSSFAFEKNLRLLCRLLQRPTANASELRKTRIFEGNLGYTFLGTVAARQVSDDNISLLSWGGIENAASQNQFKIRKMYTLILMVSVLRTLYARATVFLSTYQDGIDADDEGAVEADISSSLFTPQKLWKALGEGPLEGLKRWYALIESHLRCEFDYSVKEVPCLCGLYGLDNAAFEEAAAANVDWKEAKRQEDSSDNTSINDGDDDDAPAVDREGGKENDVTVTAPVGSVDTTEDESPDSLPAFLHEVGMSVEQHTALVNAKKPRETAEEWSLQTYRSAVGEGGVNPRWDPVDNKFVFRFAIPTHGRHTTRPTTGVHFCNGGGGGSARGVDAQSCRVASRLWNAEIDDQNHAAVKALEKLLPSVFSGPPAMLRCAMYQKNKVLSHQFMGRAKVPLDELTSGNPMDCWLPLEDTTRGSLHVKISLSFQLMCSSMAGQPNSKDLR